MVLDVLPHRNLNLSNEKSEKVIICLPGTTGTSKDNFVVEMVGETSNQGYNLVVFNHFALPNHSNLRMMDMCQNKYIDEVI